MQQLISPKGLRPIIYYNSDKLLVISLYLLDRNSTMHEIAVFLSISKQTSAICITKRTPATCLKKYDVNKSTKYGKL